MNRPVIAVVGSINADDSIRLARLPGPGETVDARSRTTSLGGKGANQAVAAARAGARVCMVGAVGHDGAELVRALAAEGIDTQDVVRVDEQSSGHAVVLVDDHGENSIVVLAGTNLAIPTRIVEEACGRLGPGDVLLVQHEIPVAISRAAARTARAAGATVFWNAAPAPVDVEDLVTDIDLLVVNEHELAAVAALLDIPPHTVDMVTAVSERMAADVVCTLGAAGATYRVDGSTGSAPARRADVVDTTAAGDTFIGYLAATTGDPFADRLATALTAGSLTVTRPGAAESIPTRSEIDAARARHPHTETNERTTT